MGGFITSNYFSNCVQNSAFQVLSEGSMKTVGRPVFTLLDKNATPEQKKYSALKEAVFQTASMVLYFVAVSTFVKGGGYRALRKMPVFKDMDVCQKYCSFGNDVLGKTLSKVPGLKNTKLCANADKAEQGGFIKAFDAIEERVRKGEKVDEKTLENFRLTKGAMEFVTMVGSGVILTILCPFLVSKKLVHPVMKKYEQLQAMNKAKKEKQNLNEVG